MMVPTNIDQNLCKGCGACVRICPLETITMSEKKAHVSGSDCLTCGQCEAVCENEAIRVDGLDHSLHQFSNFETDHTWIPYGKFDPGSLIQLMRSRRSCRRFKDTPVERSLLEDLVKIGVTAPSGSNCQMWTFTILPDRKSVKALAQKIRLFFDDLNQKAEKRWLRSLLSLIGKKELAGYYKNYYPKVKEKIEEWDKKQVDRLFHGAPAVIVVASKTAASCPAEDALLATQNLTLGAHALGLGTCLIGYAVSAMERDPSINRYLGIPTDEKVYAVIAVGVPKEKYHRLTGRKSVTVRFF